MNKKILEIVDVSKHFGRRHVLRNISLHVDSGEIVCLLGRSGAGKTTLLRVIAGLTKPSSGHVLINGEPQLGVPTQDRNLGFVFQNPEAVMPHMTVFENVAFPFRVGKRKGKSGNWRRAVYRSLELFELQPHAQSYPTTLSGGERQRVALARSFVYNPAILLLDEPLRSLDNLLRDMLVGQILDMRRNFGSTMIYVTHDEREALAMGDRIALLIEGELGQISSPFDFVKEPASERIAELTGAWNLLEGKVESEGLPLHVVVRDANDPLILDTSERLRKGEEVTVGIPISSIECVTSGDQSSPEGKIRISARIKRLIPWYGNYRILAEYEEHTLKVDVAPDTVDTYPNGEITLQFPVNSVRIWAKKPS